MKKVILIGLLAGVTMLIASFAWGALSNIIWPSLAGEYQDPKIFRPWSDPLMSLFFLHPIMVGVILSWIWLKTNHLIKLELPAMRGVMFGFLYWTATIPGMLISYSTFQVSFIMVVSWTLNGLLQAIVGGLVFSYYDLLNGTKTK